MISVYNTLISFQWFARSRKKVAHWFRLPYAHCQWANGKFAWKKMATRAKFARNSTDQPWGLWQLLLSKNSRTPRSGGDELRESAHERRHGLRTWLSFDICTWNRALSCLIVCRYMWSKCNKILRTTAEKNSSSPCLKFDSSCKPYNILKSKIK